MEKRNVMTIEAAMKVLNMKTYDAEELNEKFRFRVQSVAQGRGGSLKDQKDIYTAWEYLNRMLARESSTRTENLLRKADKSTKMYQKPKHLDMIPLKLNNPTRKASLIIEKKDKKRESVKEMKSILKAKGPESIGVKLPPIRLSSETRRNISAPGGGSQKRVRWKEDENMTTSGVDKKNTIPANKQLRKKLNLRSMATRQRLFENKENIMLQLKEPSWTSKVKNEDDIKETKVRGKTLEAILDDLPTLLKKQKTPFKRVLGLNEIYANPKRLSKHDQRSAAQRMLWKEKSDRILKDVEPGKAKRKQSVHGGKPKTSGQVMRKSHRKHEAVLYRKFNHESSPAIDLPNPDSSPEQRNPNKELILFSKGLYTPSRIKEWIESSRT